MVKSPRFLRIAVALGAGAVLSGLFALGDATARTSFDSRYTLEQTYNAALRYVRVDLGLKVTEKDPGAAYVLFDYRSAESGERISSGAIEMVPAQGAVKVVVQLPQMPRYHEQVMVDALAKKLRDEYGEPPRKAPPPPPAPDGGAPEGGDAE